MEEENIVGLIGAKVLLKKEGYNIKTQIKMKGLPKQAMAELILTMEAVVKKLKQDYTEKFIQSK